MRSPQEHLEQAERYADAVLDGIKALGETKTPVTATDVALNEMFLHAADVELKLAQANRPPGFKRG